MNEEQCLEKILNQFVIAGPILRRVDDTQVCIWIATTKNTEVTARIYKIDERTLEKVEPEIGFGVERSKKIGVNLYLTLVIATPFSQNTKLKNNSFPLEQILGYDLEFKEIMIDGLISTETKNLASVGLLESITYEVKSQRRNIRTSLPTFYIQEDKMVLRLLHGSCRALHGRGPDASALADDIIKNNLFNKKRRPSVLFLTGDQIYADDVAGALIGHITKLGIKLLGFEQILPGFPLPSTIKLYERDKIITHKIGLTSTEAYNHLLSVGEYITMYLLAWNEKNWPCSYPKPPSDPKFKEKFFEQVDRLKSSKDRIKNFRRAMANVPTYMIFDDHDVTDDWNTDGKWNEKVLFNKNRAGRNFVVNALVAYCLFQAWGDAPTQYSDMVSMISNKFQELINKLNPRSITAFDDVFVKLILEFNDWGFLAPTHPVTLFLDTRTRRGYEEKAPQLINKEQFQLLKQRLLKLDVSSLQKAPLLIVSPAPVFGPFAIERGQAIYGTVRNNYDLDNESWIANKKGLLNLMEFLIYDLKINRCVFLSGDVHFAYTIKGTFTPLPLIKEEMPHGLEFIQLTSSAFKNITPMNDLIDTMYDKNTAEIFGIRKLLKIAKISDKIFTKGTIKKIYDVYRLVFGPVNLKDIIDVEGTVSVLKSHKSEYVETRIYVYPHAYPYVSRSKFLFNATNIGYVLVSNEGNEISHWLYFAEFPLLPLAMKIDLEAFEDENYKATKEKISVSVKSRVTFPILKNEELKKINEYVHVNIKQ